MRVIPFFQSGSNSFIAAFPLHLKKEVSNLVLVNSASVTWLSRFRTVPSSCVQLTSNPGFEIEEIMAKIKEGLANKEQGVLLFRKVL